MFNGERGACLGGVVDGLIAFNDKTSCFAMWVQSHARSEQERNLSTFIQVSNYYK